MGYVDVPFECRDFTWSLTVSYMHIQTVQVRRCIVVSEAA
jgi:hypothetical protein